MDTRNIRSNNGGNVSFKEDTPYLVLVRKEHGSPYPVEVVFEKERSYGDRHCYFRDIDTEEDAAKILE